MLEILAYSAAGSAALVVLSAFAVGALRKSSVVGPLVDQEARRPLWQRLPALALWLTGVLFGAWYLNLFLASVHEWVGYAGGGVVGAALAALGIGVALL